MRAAKAMVLGCLLWSCKSSGGDVQCADDTNCNAATGGVCQENPGTEHQWCSYPDLQCPSGFRWSNEDVGDSVGGYCVDLSVTDKTPPVVVSRTPTPDDPSASPSVVLSITFSEKIDPAFVTSSSVQLQLDGGGAVSAAVATNGESVVLIPSAPLDPKKIYKISVSTEIRDLAGNRLAEPAVWGFTTREASWKPQVLLEQEQGKRAVGITAASNGNGVIMVTWAFAPCTTSQQCGFANELWVAIRKNQSWLPATRIGTSAFTLGAGKIAIDELGRAVVMWGSSERQFTGSSLVAASYDGNTWSPPVTIEQMDEMNTHAVIRSIAADGSGGMLAIWERTLGINAPDRFDVRAARFVQGVGWGATQTIDLLAASLSSAQMVSTGAGTASAVWIQDGKLRLAKFANSSWSAPEEGPPASSTCLSLAAYTGEVTASWRQGGIYATRYRGNAWESAKRLDAPGGPSVGCEAESTLRYLADGTAVTAWAAGNDVQQSTRVPGQDWGLSFPIEPGNSTVAQVRLATGSARALAMFYSNGFQSNEYNPTSGWRGAEIVPTEGTVGDSQLIHDTLSNTFVFVFEHSNPNEVTSVSAKIYQ